jgi:hypothetical protein
MAFDPLIQFAHVGLFKTGTTWLQNVVFSSHPQLRVPGTRTEAYSLSSKIGLLGIQRNWDFEAAYHREIYADYVRQLPADAGLVVGISDEGLCGHMITGYDAEIIAPRLREVFGPIRIFMVLRHPIDYISSMYNQYVKQGGALSIRALLCDSNIPGKAIPNRIDYLRLIRIYHTAFGADNVLILPFELLKENQSVFLNYLWDFLSVERLDPSRLSEERPNPSFSPFALQVMRLSNYLGFDRRQTRRWLTRLDRYLRRIPTPFGNIDAAYLLSLPGGSQYPGFKPILKTERYEFWDGELARFNYKF